MTDLGIGSKRYLFAGKDHHGIDESDEIDRCDDYTDSDDYDAYDADNDDYDDYGYIDDFSEDIDDVSEYGTYGDDRYGRFPDDENDDRIFEKGLYDAPLNGIGADAAMSDNDEKIRMSDESAAGRLPFRKGPFLFIACAFAILFVMLIGRLIYFNIYEKDDVLNSAYNKRQNSQADYVVRGDIQSIDGMTLAETVVYDDGTEERVYPYYDLYAHVVGFTTHGKSGLESYANYQLLTAHNNIIDQIINGFRNEKNPGDTVVSTINSRIQEACYYALDDYRGAIVVMNPKTGAILAMVSQPNFDPNTLEYDWDEMVADSSNSQLLNRATQGLYAPGSTFKIVTALAYYRKYGTLDQFSFDCTGELEVGNSTVHCYNEISHGEENFYDAFAHSCNTAFAEIGLDLGTELITATAKDLLFGGKLPCPITASKPRWNLTSDSDEVELTQTAFGQGKTVTTPYHMALICSAIANDGILMTPYLIDHIENNVGEVVSTVTPSRYTRLMTETESEILSGLMEEVVETGTASELSGRSYFVAGKTGSAEYTKSDGTMGTHSWFVGFAGYDEAEVVIAVLAENGGAGSTTAVPMAEEVLDACFSSMS